MGDCVYYEYIGSDDDTITMKHLTHPETRPTRKKNIGGYLPKYIPVHQWFTDLTHRAKYVTCALFELIKSAKSMRELYSLRLKKDYSYYIKMNRKKCVEDVRNNIMAPLDHMFDDHHMCDSKLCYKKRIEEDATIPVDDTSERMMVGYYRCNVKDTELYEKLCNKYEFYTTYDKTTQCKYEYDTQTNEGMNICVSK